MSGNRLQIGNVEVLALSDGRLQFVPSEFFPTVSEADWEPYRDQLEADGSIVLNVGSFLLRSDGRTVLIDTGLGESSEGMPNAVSGLLLRDMADNGVRPD